MNFGKIVAGIKNGKKNDEASFDLPKIATQPVTPGRGHIRSSYTNIDPDCGCRYYDNSYGSIFDKTFTMTGREIDPLTSTVKDVPVVISCSPDAYFPTAYGLLKGEPVCKMLRNPVIVGSLDHPM